MSSNQSFHSSKRNEDENMISLHQECFLPHHPSRKVIHYSSKQFPFIKHKNVIDFKSNHKPKINFQIPKHQTQNSVVLTRYTTVILNKGLEEYEGLMDTDEERSPNSSDVDDINNISYFILDEPEL